MHVLSAVGLLLSSLGLILPPGTAESPSAVCPLRLDSAPVAVWYDRNAIHVGAESFSWASLGVEPKEGAKATLRVAGRRKGETDEVSVVLSSSAPKFRLGDFGVVGNRVVTNSVEIVPTKDAVFYTRLFATGPRPDYLMQRKSQRIAAGTRGVVRVGGRAPQSGKLNFRFWTTDGEFYYYLADVFHAPEKQFDFQTLWASRAGDVLHVKFGGWTDDPGCRLRLTMNDLMTDTIPAWSAELPIGPSDGDRTLDFDVRSLPGGFYRVHVDFLDAAGKVVHSDLARLMRPSGPMPWEGTALGTEDTVPPPWTKPVFAADGTVSVWGREIKLGGDGLVERIVNRGSSMLAGPATLVWNGRPLAFDVVRTECRNASATYLLAARGAPVSVEAFCEFDGHIRFQTTYHAPVESLGWRIPVWRKYVVGFDDCSSEGNPDVLIPKEGVWARDFDPEKTPFWWMPGRVGLMGGFYNLHGTRIRSLGKAVSVRAAGDVVTVTSALVDTPLSGGGSRTVRHYLEPTPVKPKNRALASLDMDQLVWWTGYLCDFYEAKYPGFDDPLRFKQMRDKIRQGKRVYFYNGSCGASPEDPIWNWFQAAWTLTEPGDFSREAPLPTPSLRQHCNWTYGCLAEKGFFEAKLWGVNWYFNVPAPEAKDLYFDLANPHRCLNTAHACVWKDDFGVVHHDWSTEPTRELHKRVYRLVKAKNRDGLLHGHPGCRRTPGDVFFDSISTGEALMPRVQRNYNYYDVFTPEMMQSYFVPRATEMVVHTPPQLRRSRECLAPELLASYDPHERETDRAIRHCAAYEKIHDLCIPRGPTHAEGPQFFKVDSPIRHLGAGTKYRAYFHSKPHPVTLSAPGPRQLWAWFSAGKKGVLVLLNDTDEPVRQTVSVDGLSSVGTELLDGDGYDFSSGSCAVDLGPRGAKFIAFGVK